MLRLLAMSPRLLAERGRRLLYIDTKSDLPLLIFNEVVEVYRSRIFLINELPGTATEKVHGALREYYSVPDEHHKKTEVMYHESGAMDSEARAYPCAAGRGLEDTPSPASSRKGSRPQSSRQSMPNMLWLGHMWALNRGAARAHMGIDQFIREQTEYLDRALGLSSN
jgi:hypothetical protein